MVTIPITADSIDPLVNIPTFFLIIFNIYAAQTLPRHILCCELIKTAITQSFLKSKFMKKSVDIENCLASSKLQKYFNEKIGKIFLNI